MTICRNNLIGLLIIEIPFHEGGGMVKINQYTTLHLQKSHIIKQLSTMYSCHIRNRLAFHNNIIFANKIHTKCCLHRNPTIMRMECHLPNKRNLFLF